MGALPVRVWFPLVLQWEAAPVQPLQRGARGCRESMRGRLAQVTLSLLEQFLTPRDMVTLVRSLQRRMRDGNVDTIRKRGGRG